MEGNTSKVFTYVILAVVIVVIGSVLIFTSVGKTNKAQVTTTIQASTTLKSTTTIAQNSARTLIPPPIPACATPIEDIYSNVTNTNGLTLYNSSNLSDYVIAPGNVGTISYNINLSNNFSITPANVIGFESNFKLNITNVAQLYNATNMTVQTGWTWNYSVPMVSRINMSYTPTNEVLSYTNKVIPVNVLITVGSNAPKETYWMLLSPGPCNGGPSTVLLTIGTNSFNGVIGQYVGPT